jgi:hypothetical protein
MKWINWFKGWPVTFMGITSLSMGTALNSGLDSGLIVNGFCMIVAGIIQYTVDR